MNKIKYFLGICALSFSPLFTSCSSDIDEPFIEVEEKQTTEIDKVWESQLNNVLREQTRNTSKKLFLLGYSYHKEIVSLADLDDGLDEIFADTAHIAYQNYVDYDFEIYTIGDVKVSEYDSIRTRIDFDVLRDKIYTAFHTQIKEGNKAHLIKLKWTYNGDVIYSTAIATNEQGILFETIGHAILMKEQEEVDNEDRKEKMVTLSRIKTRAESSSGSNNSGIVEKIYDKTFSSKNNLGNVAFEFRIECHSYFHESNGVLAGRGHNATPYPKFGYSGDVKLAFSANSIIGQSTHNEFSWAWAYGFITSSVKVTYNGVGFEISGNDIKNGTGSDTHWL